MNWILENWQGILGGGSLTTIITYFVNRNSNKADLIAKIQGIYDGLVSDLKTDREELKSCNIEQDSKIKQLSSDVRDLQKQLNDLYISYAKEVEASAFWKEKFSDLEKKYTQLEADHETLKKEFETYKKNHK